MLLLTAARRQSAFNVDHPAPVSALGRRKPPPQLYSCTAAVGPVAKGSRSALSAHYREEGLTWGACRHRSSTHTRNAHTSVIPLAAVPPNFSLSCPLDTLDLTLYCGGFAAHDSFMDDHVQYGPTFLVLVENLLLEWWASEVILSVRQHPCMSMSIVNACTTRHGADPDKSFTLM